MKNCDYNPALKSDKVEYIIVVFVYRLNSLLICLGTEGKEVGKWAVKINLGIVDINKTLNKIISKTEK